MRHPILLKVILVALTLTLLSPYSALGQGGNETDGPRDDDRDDDGDDLENNTAPAATLEANVTQGSAPLDVSFRLNASDADGDRLEWTFDWDGDGTPDAQGRDFPTTINVTYEHAGNHTAHLNVSDGQDLVTRNLTIMVSRGTGPEPTRSPEPTVTRGPDDDDDDDDDGDDGDDGPRPSPSTPPADVRSQVGKLRVQGDTVTGQFIAFRTTEAGIADYAYRGRVLFETIAYPAPPEFDDVKVAGAKFDARGDDATFSAFDTPNGHFHTKADEGLITFILADGLTATRLADASGPGNSKVRITGPGLNATLHGHTVTVNGDTIRADRDARLLVEASELRGHLSQKITNATEEGRVGAEVLVPRETDGPEVIPVAHGPYELTAERDARSVRVVIEGHGEGTTLLFDLERDALGRVEDLVVRFDGVEIGPADDLEDVLSTSADEPAEYIIVVGREKAQVLVSVPHFSVHVIELASTGPVSIVPTLLGSPVAAIAAATVAGVFIIVTWSNRNRQR